jgi:hypothetical protein
VSGLPLLRGYIAHQHGRVLAIVDTTYFPDMAGRPKETRRQGDHRLERPDRPRFRRRSAAVLLACGALGSALLLSGCGQNFSQDGGTLPVPRASTDGDRQVTPEPVDSADKIIGPGYAPPRTAGPTQTAVPNLPGGKQ